MHWNEVDGVLLPVRLGGHVGLDFCNTWAGWGEPPSPRREWIKTYEHLAVWAMSASLVTSDEAGRVRHAARRDPGRARGVLSAARRFRTAAHTMVLDPNDARAAALVTGKVRRSGSMVRIEAGQPPRWTFPDQVGLELPLLAIAWSVADLLTRADLDRVRACPGHDCGWMFLDTGGRRRWCSMSVCGNRAKVSAFARRHERVPSRS
jgi:predicted RNA-binding Zn ribbon-like protein